MAARAPRYQIGGTTLSRDKKRKAMSPGRRTSASGKKYTERRRNRSDLGGRL